MPKTLKTFLDLFEPFPDELKSEKKQGGQDITFVEWHEYVIRAHRTFPQGYSKAVEVTTAEGYDKKGAPVATLIVKVRITDEETGAYQEALGSADAGKTSWGGAVAEAESQAMRRAFANWGLGLEMYLDDDQWEFWNDGDADDRDEENHEEEDDRDPDEMDLDDPDDDMDFESDVPEGSEASERQEEVVTQIGRLLAEYAEEHDDDDLEEFLEAMRTKLAPGMTKTRVGSVIKRMRKKLDELDLDDPTKDGD